MQNTPCSKVYAKDKVTLQHNQKTGEVGTIDIFRGCLGCEMSKSCYAAKGARRTGINFFQPIRRDYDERLLKKQLKNYEIDWVRIGCISDPSLDWSTTNKVIALLSEAGKKAAVITKVYNIPAEEDINELAKGDLNIQISVCGLTPIREVKKRKAFAIRLKDKGILLGWRINSAAWKKESKAERVQNDLILFAREKRIEIIDTPLRLFTNNNFWNHVDQNLYHRHLSPISGKLDNQRTAGLIIPDSYPCYSTCSPTPTEFDPIGCKHQCLTRMK